MKKWKTVLRRIIEYLQVLARPLKSDWPSPKISEPASRSTVRKIIAYLQVLNMPRATRSNNKKYKATGVVWREPQ